MHRHRAWRLGLLLLVLTGCTGGRTQTSSSWLNRFRAMTLPAGADTVEIDYALVCQPAPDAYLDHELWQMVDEQKLPFDVKRGLDANGLRVGTFGGNLPDELQALLNSPKARVAANQFFLKPGSHVLVPLAASDQPRALKVVHNGETTALDVDRAHGHLLLLPTVTEEGKLVLRCEPQLQHGANTLRLRTTDDKSNFSLLPSRAVEKYAQLAWELPLSPNEYLIVGGLLNRPQTVGHASLVSDDSAPSQYVLIIRASRRKPETPTPSAAPVAARGPGGPAVPLAVQSILTPPPAPSPGPGRSPQRSLLRAKSE